jgi:hypothetical protein
MKRFLPFFLIFVLFGHFANAKLFYGAGGVPGSALYVSASAVTGTGISGGSGYLNAGKTYTITLTMSEAATIAGGTPTMTMNEGDTATYQSGSGTTSLVFTATVNSSANTSKLAVSSFNYNGATIVNGSTSANMTGALNPLPGTLVIITTPPSVASITTNPVSGSLVTGQTVALSVTFTNPVVVNTGSGMPTMCLNSGGTGIYSGGSGTATISFLYTIVAGNSTTDLAPCATNAIVTNGATIQDQATNTANLSGANGYTLPGTILINQSSSGPACSSSGTAYYVSQVNPTGSDLNNGKSTTAPFLTLAKLYSTSFGPNDCINLNSLDAQCQGYINGFTLTVLSCSVGTIHVNDPVSQLNAAGVGLETQVVSQTSGTTGGAGVYTVRSWQSTGQVAGSAGNPLTLVFGQVYVVGGQQDVDNACLTFNQHNVPSGGGGDFIVKSYGGGVAAIAGSSACANTANIWPLVIFDGIDQFTWYGTNIYVSGYAIATAFLVANHSANPPFYAAKTIHGTIQNSAIVGANSPSNAGGDNMGVNILLGDANSNGSTFTIDVKGNTCVGGFTAQTGLTDACISETDYHLGSGDIIEGNVCANAGGHGVSADNLGCINVSALNTIVRWNHVSHNGANGLNYCGGMSGIESYAGNGGSVGAQIYQNEVDFQQPVGTIGGGFCDDEGIDLDGGTNNALVWGNYVHDNYGPGLSGIPAALPWGTNTYRFNLAINNYTGAYNNGYFTSVEWGDNGNTTWSGPIFFYNNSIYDYPTVAGTGLFGIQTKGGTPMPPGSVVANNIFSTNSNGVIFDCFGSSTIQSSVKANATFLSNAWYNRSAPGTVSICGYNSLAAWQAVVTGGDAGAQTGNPNWLGPTPPVSNTCETSALPPGLTGPQPCPDGFALTSSSGSYLNGGSNVAGIVGGSMGSEDYYGNPLVAIPIGAAVSTTPDLCGGAAPSGSTTTISADYQYYTPLGMSYGATNSPWNMSNPPQSWTESATIYGSSFPNGTEFSWNVTTTGGDPCVAATMTVVNVCGYNALTFGNYNNTYTQQLCSNGAVGPGCSSPTQITPAQINSISTLTACHSITLGTQPTTHDVIYDMFTTATPNSTSHVHEIVLFAHTPSYMQSFVNGLATKYTTTFSGITWTVGVNGSEILFMPSTGADVLNITSLNILTALQFLVTQGTISGSEYFNGLGLGSEENIGSSTLTINGFAINYAP